MPAAQNDEVRAIDAGDEAFSPRLEINLGTARDLHLPVEQPYTTTIYVDSTLDELDASFFFNGAPDAAQLTLTEPKGHPLLSAPSCESDGVFVSEVDADDQGNTAETATALPGDNTEAYGYLDSARDSDVFRVVSLTVPSR